MLVDTKKHTWHISFYRNKLATEIHKAHTHGLLFQLTCSSVFSCHREKKTSVAARRERIPAKKTTKKCLTERSFKEENIPCPQRSLKSKTTRCVKKNKSCNAVILIYIYHKLTVKKY